MMDQGDLFTGEAYHRRTDPDTSIIAAQTVDASALEMAVYRALQEYGDMTSTETAARLGKDKWSISPRFAPLQRRGLTEDTGTRRGRSIVWRAL